jgi:tetratricopeptide (TPR) repeat protein
MRTLLTALAICALFIPALFLFSRGLVAPGLLALAGALTICAVYLFGGGQRTFPILSRRHDDDRRALDDEIERHPHNAGAYVQRAALRFNAGDLDGALDDYSAALEQNIFRTDRWGFIGGSEATIRTARGQVYFALERYRHALEDFEAAHEAQPHFHPALAWLAIVHYALRHLDDAHEWWQLAVDHHPEYRRLDGTNWIDDQPGWLQPPIVPAQAVTALLNARELSRS